MPLHEKFIFRFDTGMTNPSSKPFQTKTLKIALISTFAVLNILGSTVPVTPIIGVSGAFFKLSWVIAPITGLILGPFAGGISCIIASLIETAVGFQDWTFGPLSLVRSAISAFQAGMIVSKRWQISASLLTLLIMIWITLPTGRESILTLIFHLTGLLLILLLREKISRYLNEEDMKMKIFGMAIVAYCGNISRHLFGNILFVTFFNLPSIVFISALPFTFIEQLTFTIGAILIGMPILHLEIHRRIR
jgi:hypothetical protein